MKKALSNMTNTALSITKRNTKVEVAERVAKEIAKEETKKPSKPAPVVKKTSAQLTLPLWDDVVRGVPNAVLRSALFTVSKDRSSLHNELIATLKNCIIHFHGERLNQSDLDVYEHLLHVASNERHATVHFSANSALTSLGLTNNREEYKRLDDCINRLIFATLQITIGDIEFKGVRLIEKAERNKVTKQYAVTIGEKMANVFATGYTQINHDERKQLGSNQLAKWLHGFYATHGQPFAYKVETLRTLSGSAVGRLGDFRKALRLALDRVVSTESIDSWVIDDDDLVHIKKPFIRLPRAK